MINKPVRGFEALVGETIITIDATCINNVKFQMESGKTVEIDCDYQHYGIGIIAATEVENDIPSPYA